MLWPYLNKPTEEKFPPHDLNKIPLSNREYYALRNLFAVVSGFNREAETLKKRCQTIPGAYRDLMMLKSVSEKLMCSIIRTIPDKKRRAIREDLDHIIVEVRIGKEAAPRDRTEHTYVPTPELDRLVDRVMNFECMLCDKTAKEAKGCKVYEDVSACYKWDFAPNGESCPLAGYFCRVD